VNEVEICNLALARIGAPVIRTINDGTTSSEYVARFYPISRDVLLADGFWGFAQAVATLNSVSETFDGWDYVYKVPEGMLRARKVFVSDMEREEYDFDLGFSVVEGERRILTTVDSAKILYTPKITDPDVFPPYFVDMLAWFIAAQLCLPLRADPSFGKFCSDNFDRARLQAKGIDASEKKVDVSTLTGGNPYAEAR
jgi:hypothetical protein